VYEQDELDKFFKVCSEEERFWFEFFLMTGMREQEVMYTYWSDVNFAASTGQPQAGSKLDPKGIQGTRDSDPCEARKEIEGLEDEVR
jgi:hypothetical protein